MMVSVIMITYGHEKYIADAIKGVFMQKTNFQIELIIANDNSPDGTDEIVKVLIESAPSNITVLYVKHKLNKGGNANYIWAVEKAAGKYIANCEGDDYWTDPLKLQKQVDFLEKNREYGMVCTKYKTIRESSLESANFLPSEEIDITTEILLQSNPVGTLTVLFNRSLYFNFARDLNFKMDIDVWLHLSTAEKKIKYLPIETAVYRVLQNSASGRSSFKKQAFFAKNVSAVREPFFKLSNLSAEQIDKILLKDFVLITNILIKGKHHRIWGQEWFRYLMGNKIRINVIPIFLKQLYRLLKD